MLSENAKKEIGREMAKYPEKRAVILAALHLVQKEEGWISQDAMEEVASLLDLTPIEVREVTSFYTMFNMRPVGRHHLQVCTNLSCALMNGRGVVEYIRRKIGIDVGETTGDERFTLSTVECLGSCGTAPMMQIGDDYHENLSEPKIDSILETLK